MYCPFNELKVSLKKILFFYLFHLNLLKNRFSLLKKIIIILSILFFGLNFQGFSQNNSEASNRIIKFYPNPATSFINFDFLRNYDVNHTLSIFNFMGKKIIEIKNTPSRINLNLVDFFRGIYIYQLRDKNGNIMETGKFQVVK